MLRTLALLSTATLTRVSEKNKDTRLKMARLSPFWLGFGLSGLVMAFLTLYNLTICEKDVICVQSSNCQHGESLQKLSDFIVWGDVPCQIS